MKLGRWLLVGVSVVPWTQLPVAARAARVPTCFGQPATIIGTTGNDDLPGTLGNDVIVGLGGNDLITGSDGDDLICGGSGDDGVSGFAGHVMVSGGPGRDSVGNGGSDGVADVLEGDGGPDSFKPGHPLVGDSIIGGAGTDVLILLLLDSGAQVDLSAGVVTSGGASDALAGIENVIGTNLDDTITGDANANRLQGRGENDVIFGLDGDDLLNGGSGIDSLDGGDGFDVCQKGESVTNCEA